MKYLIIALMLLPVALHAQSRMQALQNNAVQEAAAMEQFKTAWNRFADAVLAKDVALIKQLSAPCIRCSACSEQAESPADTQPDESRPVPISSFISDHLPSIFDAATRSRLKNTDKLVFADDSQNRDLYQAACMGRTDSLSRQKEVLLLRVDPSPETDGLQQAFSFMETPEGYKFCGYATIP